MAAYVANDVHLLVKAQNPKRSHKSKRGNHRKHETDQKFIK